MQRNEFQLIPVNLGEMWLDFLLALVLVLECVDRLLVWNLLLPKSQQKTQQQPGGRR